MNKSIKVEKTVTINKSADELLPLGQAAHGYHIFQQKLDHCVKVVLKP